MTLLAQRPFQMNSSDPNSIISHREDAYNSS